MAETFGSIAAVVGIDGQQLLFGERGGRVPCRHVSIGALSRDKNGVVVLACWLKTMTQLSFRPQNYHDESLSKRKVA